MCCVPAGLIVGIVGIVLDRRKWLAVLSTVVAGLLILLLLVPILLLIFCAR